MKKIRTTLAAIAIMAVLCTVSGTAEHSQLFPTLDAAATDFARIYNKQSMVRNCESGSRIYPFSVTTTRTTGFWWWKKTVRSTVTQYAYPRPDFGEFDRTKTSGPWNFSPEFKKIHNVKDREPRLAKAYMHTHGRFNFGYTNEFFSSIDRKGGKGDFQYLVAPSGNLYRGSRGAKYADGGCFNRRSIVANEKQGIKHDGTSPMVKTHWKLLWSHLFGRRCNSCYNK